MAQNMATTTPNPFTTDDLNRLLQIWTMAVSDGDMNALRQLQTVALQVAQLPSQSPLLQLGRADMQSLMTMIQSLASIV